MVFKQEFDDVAADSAAPIRYRTRPGVDFTTAADPKTGVHQFFAKDRTTGETYHIGEEELFICQLLDGRRSLDEIQAAFKGRFGLKLTQRQFSEFLRELDAAGFLATTEAPAARPLSDAGPAERTDAAEPPTPFHFRLFNPAPLFGACAWLFRPLRFFVWLLPPATLLAGLILFHRRVDIFVGHDIVVFTTTSLLAAGLATLMVTNLLARIVQGSVARAFGATIRDFGITFSLGIIPGFYIDRRPINLLTHRERVWCHAAPLLARLAFFVIGTFLWISLRPSASGLSEVAFFVGQIGFWSLVFSSIPFLPTDGYLLAASLFGRADYMDRAFRVVGMRVAGQPLPQALRSRDKWLFLLFAGAVMLCIAAAVAGGILFLGVPLEDRYRGAGAAMIIGACCLAGLWLYFSWRSIDRLRAAAKTAMTPPPNVVALSGQTAARAAAAPYAPKAPSAAPSQTIRKPRRSLVPYFIWGAIIVGLSIVAFLPYPYEAGGDFLVLPSTRVEVRARVDGEVLELRIKEGDLVEEGQPLARLSSWDEERDLAVAKASLDKSRAELQVLEDGPKPEDIKLAESQVAAANARITFSRAEADRQSQLIKSGTSSRREAEHAWSEYKKDLADLAVAQANLEVVKSGSTASMLAVARADVTRLQEQVTYLESQIERTEIRAPVAGHIVTSNIELQRGMYLTVGSLFAVIERSQLAQAEILVPETDIGEVKVGADVRLKPWGNSDMEIAGHVVSISPVAEKTPYGPVIHVKSEIDNADGFLRADMTGYAKIAGSEMPVWEAYTRLFVRFFNIEVWSWIP